MNNTVSESVNEDHQEGGEVTLANSDDVSTYEAVILTPSIITRLIQELLLQG